MLAKLRELTDAKMSELALTIRLHDEGRDSAALGTGPQRYWQAKNGGYPSSRCEAAGTSVAKRGCKPGRFDQNPQSQQGGGRRPLSAISLLALLLYLRKSAALVRHQLELKQRAPGRAQPA